VSRHIVTCLNFSAGIKVVGKWGSLQAFVGACCGSKTLNEQLTSLIFSQKTNNIKFVNLEFETHLHKLMFEYIGLMAKIGLSFKFFNACFFCSLESQVIIWPLTTLTKHELLEHFSVINVSRDFKIILRMSCLEKPRFYCFFSFSGSGFVHTFSPWHQEAGDLFPYSECPILHESFFCFCFTS